MKIRPVGVQLFHVDRQTDRHDEANSRFSQFCEKRPIKRRTANWIDHMLRTNCLRSKVIEINKNKGKENEEEDVISTEMTL